jgi:hypothetical protein
MGKAVTDICVKCGRFRSSLDIGPDGICRQCKGLKSILLTWVLQKKQKRKEWWHR